MNEEKHLAREKLFNEKHDGDDGELILWYDMWVRLLRWPEGWGRKKFIDV